MQNIMRVDQTLFGHPNGNCFSACIASVLHLPIENVPSFMGRGDGGEWFDALAEWLKPRGLYPLFFNLKGWSPPDDAVCILGGKSPRGDFMHAVVGVGARVEHDPHPSRAGLVTMDDVTLLVPYTYQRFAEVLT